MSNNIELHALKYLLEFELYQKYRKHLNLSYIKESSKELYKLYLLLDSFMQDIRKDSNLEEFRFFVGSQVEEKDLTLYNTLLDVCDKETNISKEGIEVVLKRLRQKEIANKLALCIYEFSEGRRTLKEVEALQEEFNASKGDKAGLSSATDIKEVTDDVELVIEHQIAKPGLRWPLDSLNKSLGSLRIGDFGFAFARPETGKTTFMAHVATFMAAQASAPVVWINNEEQGEKVRIRLVQASLGATTKDIMDVKSQGKGVLNQKYKEATGKGVRLLDDASISKTQIESFLASMDTPPSLIIIDQIDKIAGFDADREDLRLGTIYQWARELAKKFAPVIAVCQADGSGEGEKWLTMANVANAKTSKQAEADFIIGIGMVHDSNYERTRFINISKNKLMGDEDSRPELRHGKFQVVINPEIARYKDIMEY